MNKVTIEKVSELNCAITLILSLSIDEIMAKMITPQTIKAGVLASTFLVRLLSSSSPSLAKYYKTQTF